MAKLCKVLRNILDKPQHFATSTQTNRCTFMYTSAFQNTRHASWQAPKHLEISTNDLYKVNDQTLEKIELKGMHKIWIYNTCWH